MDRLIKSRVNPKELSQEEVERLKAESEQRAEAEIKKQFTHHPPKGDQVERFNLLREFAKNFAFQIYEFCPDGPEQYEAIKKVREAVMWANAGIAVTEAEDEEPSWAKEGREWLNEHPELFAPPVDEEKKG